MSSPVNVLSLFDGISCARVALDRVWIKVDKYYASEVDKYAIQVSKKNYPDIESVWNVKNVKRCEHGILFYPTWPHAIWEGLIWVDKIDLLIWWSPCQDLSIAKKDRKGLDWDRSGLFWEYVRILREVKPTYFILENVASMPQDAKDTITRELWVEPIMINAALVGAQTRKRLFWTNIPGVKLPDDRNIVLQDILQIDWLVDERMVTKKWKAYTLTASYNWAILWNSIKKKQRTMVRIVQRPRWFNKRWEYFDKSPTLTANHRQENNKLFIWDDFRKLTPIECERLQWLPDNYTEWVSNTQRYKCLWNAFNVDVVAHILSFIK